MWVVSWQKLWLGKDCSHTYVFSVRVFLMWPWHFCFQILKSALDTFVSKFNFLILFLLHDCKIKTTWKRNSCKQMIAFRGMTVATAHLWLSSGRPMIGWNPSHCWLCSDRNQPDAVPGFSTPNCCCTCTASDPGVFRCDTWRISKGSGWQLTNHETGGLTADLLLCVKGLFCLRLPCCSATSEDRSTILLGN